MAFFQGETLWVNQLADGLAALVLDVPDRKINVLGEKVITDMEQALERVAVGTFRALLVRSGKPDSFCAGADLHELAATAPDQVAVVAERGQRLFARLAELPTPTVAVIAGPCLGGGLELALACDYRFVVDRPRTQLGLPEVELGLLPAWGGTQRLPRVIGLERGLQMILAARRLSARDALAWGLADHIIDNPDDIPPELLANLGKRSRAGLPRRTWRQTLLESTRLGRWLLFRGAARILDRRVPDDMPAPWQALEAVRVGLRRGMDFGLAYEREAIARLAATPACRNLIRLFLQRQEARKPPEKKRQGARTIRRVGIIGAGSLGLPIAQLAIVRGFEIVIKEAGEMALGYTMLRLLGQLEQAVSRGQLTTAEYAKRLAAIRGTTAWKNFDALDLVIDARDEESGNRSALFAEMEQQTPAAAILTSAASTVTIDELQAGLQHPERVCGVHFLQPVARVPLVEIVAGPKTDAGVVQDLKDWVRKLGRTGLVVKDRPGFLVQRILFPGLNEAVLLLVEGIAAARIDEAMERFGMPQGPLDYLDQMGVDEAVALCKTLQPVYGERVPLSPVFDMMVEENWRGLKSGAGFYRYRRGRKKGHAALSRMLAGLVPGAREILSRDDQIALVQERVTGLIVNEAAICLEEGLATAETIDLAMVLAGTWAPHRGGPLRFAMDRGVSEMVNMLVQLAGNYGPRFEPCALLRRWAGGAAPASS